MQLFRAISGKSKAMYRGSERTGFLSGAPMAPHLRSCWGDPPSPRSPLGCLKADVSDTMIDVSMQAESVGFATSRQLHTVGKLDEMTPNLEARESA